MCHSSLRFLIVVSASVGVVFSARSLIAQDQKKTDGRVAWQFIGTQDKLPRVFRQLQKDRWELLITGEPPIPFTELDRKDEFLYLQNDQSKLIYRLSAERGYWRTPTSDPEDWKTWVKGSWVDPGTLPNTLGPASKEYVIKLAYFVPVDRRPVANYDRKIRVVMKIVSELYREDLQDKNYNSEGFHFELGADGEPVVHLVRGEKTAGHYNNAPVYDDNVQWNRIVPELREELGSTDEQVLIAFAETYDNGPSENLWPGCMARGAYYTADGGLGIYTAHLLKDEFCATTLDEQRKKFFDQTPVPGRRAMGHKMNSPRCEFVEDGIGAVAHELGHALGLPHDRRRDDVYIMGNGFRNLRYNFTSSRTRRVQFSDENARLLMASRYLNPGLDETDNISPELSMTLTATRSQLFAEVTATDNLSLTSIVFLDTVEGSIVEGQSLKGPEATLRQRIDKAKLRDGEVEILCIVTDAGGNQTRVPVKLQIR